MGGERSSLSEPDISSTPGTHRVKYAIKLPMNKFVVECRCGWSSAIHQTASEANEAYALHKALQTTKGTES
jgi:hypothetical protein